MTAMVKMRRKMEFSIPQNKLAIFTGIFFNILTMEIA
jgi:hypothetical protein